MKKYCWINDWHWNRSGAENTLCDTGGLGRCMLGIVLECIYPLDSGWKVSLWVFEKHQFLISPCMFFKVKIMACEKFLKFGDVQRA